MALQECPALSAAFSRTAELAGQDGERAAGPVSGGQQDKVFRQHPFLATAVGRERLLGPLGEVDLPHERDDLRFKILRQSRRGHESPLWGFDLAAPWEV